LALAEPPSTGDLDIQRFEIVLEDAEGPSIRVESEGRAYARFHGSFEVSKAQAAEALQLLVDAGVLDLPADLTDTWVLKQAGSPTPTLSLRKASASSVSVLHLRAGPVDKQVTLSRDHPVARPILDALHIWVVKMTPNECGRGA